MSYTVIYTDYNGYPGSKDTYDFFSGAETPLLPDVNLYNTFNFEIESTSAASGTPSTQESGAGSYNKAQSWRTSSSRSGSSCLLYTSPSPRDQRGSRMPSSA